jgi:SAM-dependent methyltransferase
MTDSSKEKAQTLTATTINYYDDHAPGFWEGTKNHDVTQNYEALLNSIEVEPPFTVLDLGCGPGRDLAYFRSLGHIVIGLDGSNQFAEMARNHSGAEVWVQDFINLDLPTDYFDGVFANASLFHVPRESIASVLKTIWNTLRPGGVLFTSNPRGNDEQGLSGNRYGTYYKDETWMDLVAGLSPINGGFVPIRQYYRPPGLPQHEQRWLATVWRKYVSNMDKMDDQAG